MTRLVPRFGYGKWSGDGLHATNAELTYVYGRVFEFAWLGLHFEIVFALERRP